MKKIAALIFFLSAIYASAAADYKIVNVSYAISGITRRYALETEVPVDKKRIFHNEEDLFKYIENLKSKIENTRVFETADVNFSITEPDENNISGVNLTIETKDSLHFLITPYPKYDSNSGLSLKLKLKDTNFLGSMKSMSSDINLAVEQKDELAAPDYKFGFNIGFDTPFKMGIFNVNWMNLHSASYTVTEKTPEWELKTGLEFSLPLNRFAINFDFYQSFVRDFDYEEANFNGTKVHYGDSTYFVEDAQISIPILIQKISEWGNVSYTPYVNISYNWDFDGIHNLNTDLKSPTVKWGQMLSISNLRWIENFRTGISAYIKQSFSYTIPTGNFTPGISGDIKAYKGFKYAGICFQIYSFAYLNGSEKIGGKLRGIRDNQYFSIESGLSTKYACETPGAFIFNFDLPIKILEVYWEKIPFIKYISFMKYLNMELQLAPFMDFALMHNRATDTSFDYKDSFLAGGLEAIMFPLKWKGIQFRANIGFDLAQMPFIKNKFNQYWRDSKPYEISIGIGLQY